MIGNWRGLLGGLFLLLGMRDQLAHAVDAAPVAAEGVPAVMPVSLSEALLVEPAGVSPEPPKIPPPKPNRGEVAAGVGGMMGGGGGGSGGPPGYDAVWYPGRGVVGQNTELGFVRQGLNLGFPVWRADGNILLARVGVQNTLFFTDAILPDRQEPFPEQLWNVSLGMSYIHKFDNGWTGILMGGVGSASDRPFDSFREVVANLGLLVQKPAANGRDTWTLGTIYMPGGPVDFPLPVVTYGWNHSEQLKVNIGIPFSVVWKPQEAWTVNLLYMPLLNINAKVSYQAWERIQLYGGYEYRNESYFLVDRIRDRDRFFVLEQRLISGLRWEVGVKGMLDMHGGYAFGRNYGEGDSQWDSLRDRVNVEPGLFLGVNYRIRF